MEEAAEKQEEHIDSGRLKRFMTHIIVAAKKVESKEAARDEVKEHVERLKMAVNRKEASKSEVAGVVNDLDASLKKILHDEDMILESQKLETKTVSELRNRLDDLNQKLIGLGRDYTDEITEKDQEVEELKKQLAVAHATIADHEQDKDERRERLDEVEAKITAHHEAKKKDAMKEVATQLRTLERQHKKLEKAGKHPKKHLNKLKKMIDTHKMTLVNMKKKN